MDRPTVLRSSFRIIINFLIMTSKIDNDAELDPKIDNDAEIDPKTAGLKSTNIGPADAGQGNWSCGRWTGELSRNGNQ